MCSYLNTHAIYICTRERGTLEQSTTCKTNTTKCLLVEYYEDKVQRRYRNCQGLSSDITQTTRIQLIGSTVCHVYEHTSYEPALKGQSEFQINPLTAQVRV